MKYATSFAVLVGSVLIALSIFHQTTEGAHYQIVRLTEGRLARLDQRTGLVAYCSVRATDKDRVIRCEER